MRKYLLVFMLAMVIGLSLSSVSAQDEEIPLPELANPEKFEVELFADLGFVDGVASKAFQLTLVYEGSGLPPGLYITSPFLSEPPWRLLYADKSGEIAIVSEAFTGVKSIIPAWGDYGEGLLATRPFDQTIAYMADLTGEEEPVTFAELEPGPTGPMSLVYGHDGLLYATGGGTGDLLRIYPDGEVELCAHVLDIVNPQDPLDGLTLDTSGKYGGGFIVSTFTWTFLEENTSDRIFAVSEDCETVTEIGSGLGFVEQLTLGPGGPFGEDLYIATMGTNHTGSGAVYTLSPDGEITLFMSGVNATHVVFDTGGILGGGMFVADIRADEENASIYPGVIWRVTPK